MNVSADRRPVVFPIAVIPAIIYAVWNLWTFLMNVITYRRLGYNVLLDYAVQNALLLVSAVFVVVVLLLRKRGTAMLVALGLRLLLVIYQLGRFFYDSRGYVFYNIRMLLIFLVYLLGVACEVLLLVFCYYQDKREGSSASATFGKIWFLPGLLGILAFLLVLYRNLTSGISLEALIKWGVLQCVGTATILLLGLWLTHPYGKNQPVTYESMGPQGYPFQPMGEPIQSQPMGGPKPSQSEGEPMWSQETAQPRRLFCPNCGREFKSTERFCIACGTPRPEVESQAEEMGKDSVGK